MNKKIVKQIAHACIWAHDIDVTSDWYSRVLGMERVFNFTRDGKIFGYYLGAGNRTHIEVFHKEASEFTDRNQINHICLEVENIDEAIAHIRAQGVEATDKANGCDDTWQSWITDPNGVKIELFEYTPESAQFVGRDRVAHW